MIATSRSSSSRGLPAEAPDADLDQVEALIAGLRAEQAEANEDLAPHLSEKRLSKLRQALDEMLEAVPE